MALFAKQKNEEAISHYKIAIKLKPYFTNVHYNLGIILLQKGEVKEAVHHFRETLRLKPSFVEARDYLELAMLK
jgi:tetratricopeptide (TPR) repeat protein